ncbi:MAG: hypothetical protein LBQ58_07020 [Synergistaceae bacterium]|nr:hypothetical protein [Synergistaceae bacterium]
MRKLSWIVFFAFITPVFMAGELLAMTQSEAAKYVSRAKQGQLELLISSDVAPGLKVAIYKEKREQFKDQYAYFPISPWMGIQAIVPWEKYLIAIETTDDYPVGEYFKVIISPPSTEEDPFPPVDSYGLTKIKQDELRISASIIIANTDLLWEVTAKKFFIQPAHTAGIFREKLKNGCWRWWIISDNIDYRP